MSQPEAPTLPSFEEALQLQQQVAAYVRRLDEYQHAVRLSEREVIRMALLLANECTPAEMREVIAFVTAGGSLTSGSPHLEFIELLKRGEKRLAASVDTLIRGAWDVLQPDREWMRSAVELVMSNRPAARIKLRSRIEEALREVLVSSPLRWDGRSLVTDTNYFALTPQALTGHAIALLLDDKRGYADKLLPCNLEGCDSIFLSISSGKGGRPPLYCTPAHQALAVKLSGPARTEKWRKSKANRGK